MNEANTFQLLAADLAGAEVDVNEAQKALAYLRQHRDPKQFFGYLRAINANGNAVIRSGRTLGYYRDLLRACERHLQGMDAAEMMATLGWALRLVRYYRAVPDAADLIKQTSSTTPNAMHQRPPAAKPTAPQIPAAGATFHGMVIAVDETAVLVEIPGFSETSVTGVMRAETLTDGKTGRYRKGNRANVEVVNIRTLKSGRTIVELKPVKKQ